MVEFDHGTLAADLAGPDDWRAATFAAARTEFLLSTYRRFADAEQVGVRTWSKTCSIGSGRV